MEKLNELSGKILDSCIEVHRHTGPGLLESIYEKCLCKELELRKIIYKSQVEYPVLYKGYLVDALCVPCVSLIKKEDLLKHKKLNRMHNLKLFSLFHSVFSVSLW